MLGRVVTYQLVIFDFDGTLADSAGWIRRVINDVAQRYRFRSVTDEEFESLRGADTRAVPPRGAALFGPARSPQKCANSALDGAIGCGVRGIGGGGFRAAVRARSPGSGRLIGVDRCRMRETFPSPSGRGVGSESSLSVADHFERPRENVTPETAPDRAIRAVRLARSRARR